jgi:hypothetical protein
MSEMMKQERRRRRTGSGGNNNSSYATKGKKQQQIQYSCGCRYLFDHQIILVHICSEHERELITRYS